MKRGTSAVALLAVIGVGIMGGLIFASPESRDSGAPEGRLLVEASFTPVMSEIDVTNKQIAFHEQRAAEYPRSALDRTALAGLYLRRSREAGEFEDYRRAEEAARASLAIRGKANSKAVRTLAASLLAQHRFTEALEVASELVRVWPEDLAHRALLAEIEMELGHYGRSRDMVEFLENEADNLAVAPRLIRWAQISGDTARERRLLYEMVEQARHRFDLPREQMAWYYLRVGEYELRNGGFERAKAAFREGLVVEPNDFRILESLVRLEALRQRWETAIQYGEVLGDAAGLRTLGILGDAHAQLGNRDAAERFYQRVEASAAETPEPFNRQLYAFRLDHDRRVPETLAILREEIGERPDVLGYDLLAWALYRAGEYEAARKASQRSLRMDTQDPNFFFHAGLIERALGNEDASRAYLEKALDINPRFHHTMADSARQVLADWSAS